MTTAEPVLTVRGLSARAGGQQVVEHVDLDVAATGVTALLGRNGVGKTSTIKAIMGLVERTGEVTLAGKRIDGLEPHRVARLGVGYVPEDREVFSALTVTENLRIAERPGVEHRYDLVYEVFPELKERGGQAAGTLSGGQQQMVALGRVLINDNAVLLIDEPTKGLSPRLVQEVGRVLATAAEVAPVLLVEQNLKVVRDLARDVVVLTGGRSVHHGDAREFLEDDRLTQRFLGVHGGEGESA
ncbi:ABC transporter ATP-binding protein [Ornithinicoccus hortensis]|uniref:Amino acid/amide ABC transporter ATP-binding protein 2 (HAAT family) n=1 Tax=Ornithinicoccus hortensis TaxID=82346 RepID=A0A542YQA2_9MICO|nr:ABC transporter ATP-binding protein [Ornithinicoccus hortensis]TQL50094.1 amino acid/amide ABC transporter ATP-binding protein 2 (HAAT family) [Ornithinicoccus hortensis]